MKQPSVYVEHIDQAIERIFTYVENMTLNEFLDDFKTQDAVIRQFEIIGEAVNHLEVDFLQEYPDLPWNKMVAMRNKLIHDYFGVDIDIVWNTIKNRLPELQVAIKRVLG